MLQICCLPLTGGGAVEAALSIYLKNFANTLGSREQLAIAEFADALLVIPKTLAVNAAKDATELVAKLRAYHYTAQVSHVPASLPCPRICARSLKVSVMCFLHDAGPQISLGAADPAREETLGTVWSRLDQG